jgi:hypothetical protein
LVCRRAEQHFRPDGGVGTSVSVIPLDCLDELVVSAGCVFVHNVEDATSPFGLPTDAPTTHPVFVRKLSEVSTSKRGIVALMESG